MGTTSAYFWRGIPTDLWRRFKSKAALRGLRLSDVLTELVRAWVKE